MIIKQFEDKPLAHYSYAILSGNEMALVDPSRDPEPYYKFAEENDAKIVAVFETHPHADFVSGHLQIHKETEAVIYVSELVGADYPHKAFDDGATFKMNEVTFMAINTPGHSPDGITIVAKDKNAKQAIFTGDTLFIGDVGRPDLREKAGNMKAKREQLAEAMFTTMQTKFNDLPDDTLVYPAHGAGSLCGKNMSSDSSSTLGNERISNWAFKKLSKEDFVDHILKDQPFIPSYFGHDVAINKTGAPNFIGAISQIPLKIGAFKIEKNILIIDTRDEAEFKKNHMPNSINIMARNIDDKIETWLGSIVEPSEPFYIVVASINDKQELLERIAKIGYESQVKAVLTLDKVYEKEDEFDFNDFDQNKENYTIVDIRNKSEFNEGHFFDSAINIPLNELRNAIDKIPTNKPIVIHCAGGYRSAAGSSIVSKQIHNTKVYDLSEKINNYKL
ncbi:glyoxylase-like metal-dependent hydrolase (beta-lactamase superfamily II) [Maribacter spongiicola]|uniref:Glyoxylase-like metal-dependent hydrolase (Beta-lactamase superfamily II) n=1 Tax=Maribacter spongiicola TaxID=1206753 RepID=A0A4R7JQP4_9FLAO|nr:MBL fold metallo-hydrolase [Maribacter spongiicola]TDT40522.1 glyoxylase-like metal-dependent hydrolase (beta-lactamase superfamily II) [Maribacter spongiicola]